MDARRFAPATLRNREPIVAVLRGILPSSGTVLEVASGSGEHAVCLAEAFPHLLFQPSDADPEALESIAVWRAEAALPNLREPVQLDAALKNWPIARADAILCINMIHIAPWASTVGLFAGATRCLAAGAPLYLYGPYRQTGVQTAPSNEAFDVSLRQRDPAWGLRDLEAVIEVAGIYGFAPPGVTPMPANNLSVVFRLR